MAKFISLNLEAPAVEKRNLENPNVSLSAGLAAMGMGTFTDSNQQVTEKSSLEVPTVLACVRILSEGVGSLPLRVYEELERGRKTAKDHYLYYLLSQEPNPECTAVTFFTTMMTHAALWQNAYAEIERDANGRAKSFVVRAPWRTKPDRNPLGRLIYKTTDTKGGATREIDADNMIHIVGFSLDSLTGTSLVLQARQSIGLAMVAAKFGARFYANGARPGFFLQPEAPLSPEDMTLLRQDVELLSSGANVHRVAAIPSGIKVTEIKIDPAQAEYNETRKFERSEIAAFFRVPGYMVGAAEKALKSSIEAQNMEFLTYSLRPWIERFEQEFQRKLLPPMGRTSGKYTVHFYTDALLSVDKSTRYTCYTQGRNGGWLSVADVRESEGLGYIEGTDTYLQPLNMDVVAAESVDEETDDEPEASTDSPTVTRAKQMFAPVFKDCVSRLQHRATKDTDTISKTLRPICEAMGTYFRTSSTVGTAEAQALDKYLKGVESRCSKWSGDTVADEEISRLLKTMVYAVEHDKAEQKASALLKDSNK